MKSTLRGWVFTVGLLLAVLPGLAVAGFDEGLAAYIKKDYVIAMRELRPLAEQGNLVAQTLVGWMYDLGQGVPIDFKQAAKW